MNYLAWKKKIRKIYSKIETDLEIDKLSLSLEKHNSRGAHIKPAKKSLFIPFVTVQYIRKQFFFRYDEAEVSIPVIYHELGHFLQYKKDKNTYLELETKMKCLLKNGALDKDNSFPLDERYLFLMEYQQLLEKCENEAWDLVSGLYKGNPSLFDELKTLGLNSHSDTCDYFIRWMKDKIDKEKSC